jgi:hypothetical protein
MPQRTINNDTWQMLINAYRDRPGNATNAARLARVDWKTANRAWESGLHWMKQETFRKPIRELLAEEQEQARARLAMAEDHKARTIAEETAKLEASRKEQIVAKANDDRADTRVQEAQLVRLCRGSTIGLAASLAKMSKGVVDLSDRLREVLETIGNGYDKDGNPRPLTPLEAKAAMGVIGRYATMVKQANEAAHDVVETERVLLGEPTAILGVKRIEEVTATEAEARLLAAQRAFERAKADGLFLDSPRERVIDVGPAVETPVDPEGNPTH